ncbi:MAG: TetR/AcrR family transcriptional regulator [Rhodocyclaceae bacterium]
MSAATELPGDPPRAEARRAQILAAAADCFCRHGFHGASIAEISQAAGMSAGHIYHYFENKEAIIAGIVAQDLERLLTLTAEFRAARNVLEAMVGHLAEGVRDMVDPATAGLKLEIVAEAARNPRVAEVVRTADRQCFASLQETVRALRQANGHDDCEAITAGMAEVIAALMEGLMVRSIRNPTLDLAVVTPMVQRIIRDLMTERASDRPNAFSAG